MSQPVFRFAPSPNGYLHLGHAYSALLNARRALECNGRLLLRIEDTDQSRARPEFVAAILEDLAWIGLEWELPVRIQSEHLGTMMTIWTGCGRQMPSIPVSVHEKRLSRTDFQLKIRMASRSMVGHAGGSRRRTPGTA
jgi:hypothetical protein